MMWAYHQCDGSRERRPSCVSTQARCLDSRRIRADGEIRRLDVLRAVRFSDSGCYELRSNTFWPRFGVGTWELEVGCIGDPQR